MHLLIQFLNRIRNGTQVEMISVLNGLCFEGNHPFFFLLNPLQRLLVIPLIGNLKRSPLLINNEPLHPLFAFALHIHPLPNLWIESLHLKWLRMHAIALFFVLSHSSTIVNL